MTLSVYRMNENAILPTYGSEGAACFDLYACLPEGEKVTTYSYSNEKFKKLVVTNSITIYEKERVLVPTGLIFDLKPAQSLRIHPRSGLALKNGIVVTNCEGVVDADYVDPTYVMLSNISSGPFEITHGMRIAQAEIMTAYQPMIEETPNKPVQKTNRTGGLGSTGLT